MAEKVVSPGVFTNEIDASFLPAAVGDIGAAIIGPTVKGPAMVPTVVQTFSDFENLFGTTFRSGSNYYQYLTSHAAEQYLQNGGPLTVIRVGDQTAATADVYKGGAGSAHIDSGSSITFETIGDGIIYNNSGSEGTNNLLASGSSDNYRVEIVNVNESKGTFNVLVRSGNDTIKRKNVLESFNNVSIDPNANNYVARVIGNQDMSLNGSGTTEPYIKPSGEFPVKSKFIRVKTVHTTTPNYLDENGKATLPHQSSSLPQPQSASFSGALPGASDFDIFGNHKSGSGLAAPSTSAKFYDEINSTNVQGLNPGVGNLGKTAYEDAINLLANQDEYDINLLMIPGITIEGESAIVQKAVDMCEGRADAFYIADAGLYGKTVSQITGYANSIDTNYASVYWPWVQIQDPRVNGSLRWVPPSVVLGGVYAFNDKVAHPWFAPAGLNRGGLDTVVQAERKLLLSQRDTLYDSNVNPIATFPGQGVTVFGQKTLQKKASALDRVNVRRLLIRVKKFIASSSRFLVFEQNNSQLRKRFLNIVNPFLEQVQSQSGLSAFRVVMDESNNTPDTIDRNQLIGQIFLQPTRTAEFIILDFTIQPTGAAFPE